MSDRVSTLTPTTNVTLGFTVLLEDRIRPGKWYPSPISDLYAAEADAITERDQWLQLGRNARVVRCVTP